MRKGRHDLPHKEWRRGRKTDEEWYHKRRLTCVTLKKGGTLLLPPLLRLYLLAWAPAWVPILRQTMLTAVTIAAATI
jgi:hypothetical protein